MAQRLTRVVVVVWLVGAVLGATAPSASASCHRFDLDVTPTSANEGSVITVTVGRDGAEADSSVRVTANSGTAQSGRDFTPLNQQVNFTGEATERSFQIVLGADGFAEPAETFTVSLSQPAGCEGGQQFDLSAPQTVRINASQSSAPPAAPPPPAPAPAPAPPPAPAPAPASPVRPTPTATATPSEEPSPEPTETSSPLPSPTPVGDESDEGGGFSPQLVIGVLALAGAVGVGAWLLNQRRNQPPAI